MGALKAVSVDAHNITVINGANIVISMTSAAKKRADKRFVRVCFGTDSGPRTRRSPLPRSATTGHKLSPRRHLPLQLTLGVQRQYDDK